MHVDRWIKGPMNQAITKIIRCSCSIYRAKNKPDESGNYNKSGVDFA